MLNWAPIKLFLRPAFLTILVVCFASTSISSQSIGPINGTCIIIGGGKLSDTIYDAFATSMGGYDKHLVIVPTAMSLDMEGGDPKFAEIRRRFTDKGFTQLDILHCINGTEAETDSLLTIIESAAGLWFTGGRQWRLVDAYMSTKFLPAFHDLLNRGGVIAGTSAGATIQGSFLVRGDTRTNTIMMGDHQQGFAFLKATAIDQHVLRRNRQFDMLEVLNSHPHLLGIGLDENTAMVINGNQAAVIGDSYVLIYENKERENGGTTKFSDSFYLLSSGQRYDLSERKIIDP